MDPFTNFDTDLSIKPLKKLTEYDIETVIYYDGGIPISALQNYQMNENKLL